MDKELLLLKIRNAIADKEMNTAVANQNLAQYGAWSSDYNSASLEISNEIESLIKQYEAIQ